VSQTSPSYRIEGKAAVITLDDGKANAVSFAVLDELSRMLAAATEEAEAVVLMGRPGRFSGGFDLSVMRGDDIGELVRLVKQGANFLVDLYMHPQPVVVACTGHAVALGSLIVMVGDYRLVTAGDFKIGLNEVAIGMELPDFAIQLANDRLSRRHLSDATLRARLYSPTEAVDAGYADEVVDGDSLLDRALGEAEGMAALSVRAFAKSKEALRSATAARVRAGLAEDLPGPPA
jgi:enoyl-CoA hydratase